MLRSSLPDINWEAYDDSRLPALLWRGSIVGEGHGILTGCGLHTTSCDV